MTEKHQTLVLLGTSEFTQLSKKRKIPFARGHPVLPLGWDSHLPALMAQSLRATWQAF